jgi:MFS family permease
MLSVPVTSQCAGCAWLFPPPLALSLTACPPPMYVLCSGDTRGRRLTLLLSIVVMAVPTVLIGCLPTYAQAGVAAPVLLALLRLVQGLAMGGEFGSALVRARGGGEGGSRLRGRLRELWERAQCLWSCGALV